MRTFCVVLAVLLISTAALADQKVKPWEPPVETSGRALDCTNAIQINCGDLVSGDNTGLPNNVDYYSCSGWLESGGEVVYELVLPEGQCYEVTGTLTAQGCDLDVFFLGSCDENDCIAYGSIGFSTSCIEPGTYYIVVDGYYGAGCPYDLEITCVECDCPVPPCCPFEYVKHLIDFNVWDGGFMVLPCGGTPVWQWGPLTNPEVPTVACDDVPVTNILGTNIPGDYPASSGEIAMIGPYMIDEYSTCLELCHFYDTENRFDGGNLKISTDGGATWILATPSRLYDAVTYSSCLCLPLENAFTGHQFSTMFLRDCFDLSGYIGTEIWIGFFFGSDSSVQYPGWYIKWVKIGSDNYSPVEDSSWGNIKSLYR